MKFNVFGLILKPLFTAGRVWVSSMISVGLPMPLPMSHYISQGHICIFQSGGGLVEELEDKDVCSEAFQLSVGKHWEVTQHYTLEDLPPKYVGMPQSGLVRFLQNF